MLKIEIKPPRLFTLGSILVIWAYGLLLVAPLLVAFLAITLIELSWWTLIIPALTLLATAWFVPLGQGNCYLVNKLRASRPENAAGSNAFLVQFSARPRLRTGLRATLEDADDFGWLSFDSEALNFIGDSIHLTVPYGNIKTFQLENVGLRGRFVYGPRLTVRLEGLSEIELVQFVERSSAWIHQSKQTMRHLLMAFQRATDKSSSVSGAVRNTALAGSLT